MATQASKSGQPQGPLAVVVLAYDGMNLLDLAGPLQALTTANRSALPSAPARYAALATSATGGAIVTGAGLPVITVSVASRADVPIDTLIVPGCSAG